MGGDWRAVATSQGVPVALRKQPEEEGIDPPWVYQTLPLKDTLQSCPQVSFQLSGLWNRETVNCYFFKQLSLRSLVKAAPCG